MGDWDTWTPTMSQTDLDALYFQTMNAGSSDVKKVWGINSAILHKQNTGIPFWCDHWRPNYHKHANDGNQWTMEQNLAYVEFFEDKLLEIGSAGAGLQTRTFWSDTTNALIEQTATSTDGEIMSVQFMDLLHQMCVDSTVSINDFEDENTISVFPNPFLNSVTIINSELKVTDIKLFNLLGQEISNFVIHKINDKQIEVKISDLPRGMYVIHLKSVIKMIYKQ
jgi:hypothetical protein